MTQPNTPGYTRQFVLAMLLLQFIFSAHTTTFIELTNEEEETID